MDARDLAALPAYHYGPIPENHFRIIHLQPGRIDETIRITIQTVKPGIRGYAAVSYVWGDNDRVHRVYATNVQLNDDAPLPTSLAQSTGYIMITENLRKVLLSLRDTLHPRTLWIDSLCINQEDPIEKSEQVSMMRNIFSIATLTTAYLGEPDDTMLSAFRTIEAIALLKHLSDAEAHTLLPQLLEFPVPPKTRQPWENIYGYQLSHTWDYFAAFLTLPWFHRVWIIQEAVVSDTIVIFAGKTTMQWDTLIDACRVIDRAKLQLESHVANVLLLELARASIRVARADSITNTMTEDAFSGVLPSLANHFIILQIRCRGFGATDPRDLVFALVGIANGHQQLLPKVDYSMSLAEVYTRTAWAWFKAQESNSVRFLSVVNGSHDVKDLPTWVPDWRQRWNSDPIGLRFHQWSPDSSPYKHLRNIVFPDMNLPRFSMPLRLTVRGIRLLTIDHVEAIKEPLKWSQLRHSQLINKLPEPYPTTYMTYRNAFQSVVQPTENDFAVTGPRSESFWSYRLRGTSRPRIRPIFRRDAMYFQGDNLPFIARYHDGPGSKPSIYIKEAQPGRGPNEPRYTQSQLYDTLHDILRKPGCFVEDGYARSRVWFVTKDGFMGLTFLCAKPGDIVVHLFGANTPHVLREKKIEGGKKVWGYIGETYVLGLMHGEAEDGFPETEVEDFVIE